MPTLKQLRYFDAVARTGHFGQAARLCAISQPALSMQIRDLEAELGATLIERLPGKARLTAAGQEIAARAASVLVDVRDLAECTRCAEGVLAGPLKLGVIPSIAPYLLPPLLPLLRQSYPDLRLHIRESQTERIVGELMEGALDLLLLALPVDGPGLVTRKLFDDAFLLAAPADFGPGKQLRVPRDVIRQAPLLLLEEGHCLRDQALAFCELRSAGDIDTFGASTLATVVQMVANGMGLTLLPELAVEVESHHEGIRLTRFKDPQPSREVGLVWRKSSPRAADFETFGEMVQKARAK